jgi:Ca2+-binding EF-hand superfamily protein
VGLAAAFDLNADRGLQFDEYLLCPRANPCAARLIGRKDADHDGRLSWDEFHANGATLFYGLTKYFFLRYDRNGDGALSLSEFDVAVEMNKAPPPPPDELAEFERPPPGAVAFEKFIADVPDGARAAKEWEFYAHDFDCDRMLREEERAIDDPSRVSPHVQHFRRLDVDRDGVLSWTEFVEPADSKREGEAKTNFERAAKSEFAMFDRDGDEKLSFEEFCFTSRLDLPLQLYFRRLDADHDGRLTCREFIAPYGAAEQLKQRINFYNWDADYDQKLSLYEMIRRGNGVATSLKNEYLAHDIDDDGKLTLAEFYREALGQPWENQHRKMAEEYDVDDDGFLSLLEYSLHRGHHFAELFALQDSNGDGSLSFLEFRQPHRPEAYPHLGQPFYLADLDSNGVLSLEEFLEHRKQGNEKEKRIRPDAVVEYAEKRLKQISQACKATDADKDGRSSRKEWPQAKIDELVPELTGIPFTDWDRNGDGFVTAEERKELVELAFGIAFPGGHRLRKPGGLVLGPIFFGFDKDKDGEVSRDEFMAAHWDQARKADLFKAWDLDGDGTLTLVEATAVNDLFSNVYADFFWFDRDFDGQVTQKELDAIVHPWEKELVDHLVSAFDLNGDGALQLDEYVLSPKAHPYAVLLTRRTDDDNDSRLSWEEYYPGKPPLFYGLLQGFFERFDRDQDGFLSLSELDFKIDIQKATPDALLVKLDRNQDGKVSMDDFLDPKLPDPNDPAAVLRHEEQTIRIEEAFHIADADGDGKLSLAELGKQRTLVMAAVEGRSIPVRAARASAASSADYPAGSSRGAATDFDADDLRMLAILGFNALLVGGVGWMILKRK